MAGNVAGGDSEELVCELRDPETFGIDDLPTLTTQIEALEGLKRRHHALLVEANSTIPLEEVSTEAGEVSGGQVSTQSAGVGDGGAPPSANVVGAAPSVNVVGGQHFGLTSSPALGSAHVMHPSACPNVSNLEVLSRTVG